MNLTQLNKVQRHLEDNARSIDLALYNFHFSGKDSQKVLSELQKYQNKDGGFGNALEPDLRLPESTAVATWAAFRIMHEVEIPADHEMLQRSLKYLLDTYNEGRSGWAIVQPEVDNYPHAPWWEYKTAMADFGWGNPSAELLGFVMTYGGTEVASILPTLIRKAVARIQEIEPSQFHEIFNFKALYELADKELQAKLHGPLEQLIIKSTTVNPDEWGEYVATPLKFISSPTDAFAHLFDQKILNENLEFLLGSIVNDDHWEPNWDWSGAYPNDWKIAKREWSGQLTVRNLLTLKSFGVIN